jgi:hypothetical protein
VQKLLAPRLLPPEKCPDHRPLHHGQVVAPASHRHYVLAIPKMLRPYFQRRRDLLKRLCTVAYESLTE